MTWEGMVEAQNALLISHTGVTNGYSPGCTPITGWPHGWGCRQHLSGDRPDVTTDPRAHPQDAGCRPRLVAVFPLLLQVLMTFTTTLFAHLPEYMR
jgi:hypothetical protein